MTTSPKHNVEFLCQERTLQNRLDIFLPKTVGLEVHLRVSESLLSVFTNFQFLVWL